MELFSVPDSFHSALATLTIAAAESCSTPSMVEVDYLRLYARVAGMDVLLDGDEYASSEDSTQYFLYDRYPTWFANDSYTTLAPEFDTVYGCVVVRPAPIRGKLILIWNTRWPRVLLPEQTVFVFATARIRITGPAHVQLSMDYYRTPTALKGEHAENLRQPANSQWICGDMAGWQVLAAGLRWSQHD